CQARSAIRLPLALAERLSLENHDGPSHRVLYQFINVLRRPRRRYWLKSFDSFRRAPFEDAPCSHPRPDYVKAIAGHAVEKAIVLHPCEALSGQVLDELIIRLPLVNPGCPALLPQVLQTTLTELRRQFCTDIGRTRRRLNIASRLRRM